MRRTRPANVSGQKSPIRYRRQRRGDRSIDHRTYPNADPVQFHAVEFFRHRGRAGLCPNGVRQLQQTVSDAHGTTSNSTNGRQIRRRRLCSAFHRLETYFRHATQFFPLRAPVLTAALKFWQRPEFRRARTVQNVRETADQNMVLASPTNPYAAVVNPAGQYDDREWKNRGTRRGYSDALDQRDTILPKPLAADKALRQRRAPMAHVDLYRQRSDPVRHVSAQRDQTRHHLHGSTVGASVYVDGAPVTGANAIMGDPVRALAVLANLRDNVATQISEPARFHRRRP